MVFLRSPRLIALGLILSLTTACSSGKPARAPGEASPAPATVPAAAAPTVKEPLLPRLKALLRSAQGQEATIALKPESEEQVTAAAGDCVAKEGESYLYGRGYTVLLHQKGSSEAVEQSVPGLDAWLTNRELRINGQQNPPMLQVLRGEAGVTPDLWVIRQYDKQCTPRVLVLTISPDGKQVQHVVFKSGQLTAGHRVGLFGRAGQNLFYVLKEKEKENYQFQGDGSGAYLVHTTTDQLAADGTVLRTIEAVTGKVLSDNRPAVQDADIAYLRGVFDLGGEITRELQAMAPHFETKQYDLVLKRVPGAREMIARGRALTPPDRYKEKHVTVTNTLDNFSAYLDLLPRAINGEAKAQEDIVKHSQLLVMWLGRMAQAYGQELKQAP